MNIVVEMAVDKWVGKEDLGAAIANPSLSEIENAVNQLDGAIRTTVCLMSSHGGLIVAGQWDGMCIVNTNLNHMEFFSLWDSSKGLEKRRLFIGGQDGDYETRKCVPLEWAIVAVRTFHKYGRLDESLPWKSDY